MIGGEFDLSIGSMIGAAGVIIAIPAVQFGLAALAVHPAGVRRRLPGRLPQRLDRGEDGLPSFIVTLAGLFILRGADDRLHAPDHRPTQISGLKDLAAADWLAPIFAGEVGGLAHSGSPSSG